MNELLHLLQSPWPWYVAGPLMGLTVPLLLWLGNKSFGISSNLRHLCAVALPERAKPGFFRYDWRAEGWSLAFALGLALGITLRPGLVPPELSRPDQPGVWGLLALSGLLIGFGTRYGGGCTSGHAITGLATLQLPSLIATVSFFVGGIFSANVLLPALLRVIL